MHYVGVGGSDNFRSWTSLGNDILLPTCMAGHEWIRSLGQTDKTQRAGVWSLATTSILPCYSELWGDKASPNSLDA